MPYSYSAKEKEQIDQIQHAYRQHILALANNGHGQAEEQVISPLLQDIILPWVTSTLFTAGKMTCPQNPPREGDFVPDKLLSKLGQAGLRTFAEDICHLIGNYWQQRQQGCGGKGDYGGPVSLFLNEFNHWAIEVLSTAEATDDFSIKLQHRINYLRSIECSPLFEEHTSPLEYTLLTLCEVLQGAQEYIKVKQLNASAENDFKSLQLNIKMLIKCGLQISYVIFNGSKIEADYRLKSLIDPPVHCPSIKTYYQTTACGYFLQQLVTMPALASLVQDEDAAPINVINFSQNHFIEYRTNDIGISSLSFYGEHDNSQKPSGIIPLGDDSEVGKQLLLKIYGLLESVSQFYQMMKTLTKLARIGGDLMVYGVMNVPLQKACIHFLKVSEHLQKTMREIFEVGTKHYKDLLFKNKNKRSNWKGNFRIAQNLRDQMEANFDICLKTVLRVMQNASNGLGKMQIKEAEENMLMFSTYVNDYCDQLNGEKREITYSSQSFTSASTQILPANLTSSLMLSQARGDANIDFLRVLQHFLSPGLSSPTSVLVASKYILLMFHINIVSRNAMPGEYEHNPEFFLKWLRDQQAIFIDGFSPEMMEVYQCFEDKFNSDSGLASQHEVQFRLAFERLFSISLADSCQEREVDDRYDVYLALYSAAHQHYQEHHDKLEDPLKKLIITYLGMILERVIEISKHAPLAVHSRWDRDLIHEYLRLIQKERSSLKMKPLTESIDAFEPLYQRAIEARKPIQSETLSLDTATDMEVTASTRAEAEPPVDTAGAVQTDRVDEAVHTEKVATLLSWLHQQWTHNPKQLFFYCGMTVVGVGVLYRLACMASESTPVPPPSSFSALDVPASFLDQLDPTLISSGAAAVGGGGYLIKQVMRTPTEKDQQGSLSTEEPGYYVQLPKEQFAELCTQVEAKIAETEQMLSERIANIATANRENRELGATIARQAASNRRKRALAAEQARRLPAAAIVGNFSVLSAVSVDERVEAVLTVSVSADVETQEGGASLVQLQTI